MNFKDTIAGRLFESFVTRNAATQEEVMYAKVWACRKITCTVALMTAFYAALTLVYLYFHTICV